MEDGEVRRGDLAGFMALIDPGMERLVGSSDALLPRPDLVSTDEAFAEADRRTLQEALDDLEFDGSSDDNDIDEDILDALEEDLAAEEASEAAADVSGVHG